MNGKFRDIINKCTLIRTLKIVYLRAIKIYSSHNYRKGLKSIIVCGFKSLFDLIKHKIVFYSNDKARQISKLLSKMTISYDDNSRFYYWIDEHIYFDNRYSVIGNLPVDYSLVINNSLSEIREKVASSNENNGEILSVLDSIGAYIDRICSTLSGQKGEFVDSIVMNLQSMKNAKACGLEDALQRILFWNALLHQTGQTLVGLGRLDYLLDGFIDENIEKATLIITDFCRALHKHYGFKSQALKGDTGQIIVLGGKNDNGSYFSNQYTYIFIEVIKQLCLPDPKLMIRASKCMPEELMEKSMECILTGNGSPLLSNDDVIIPLLIDFGYENQDAYNYAVSACWEPLIIGKSMDQNNLSTFPFAKVFFDTLKKCNNANIKDLEGFLDLYEREAQDHLIGQINLINNIIWERTPLISLFFEDCLISGKDISQGGAKYNNYGILSDGLGNTVNSLLNLDRIVFSEKRYSLNQVYEILSNDFRGFESLKTELVDTDDYFGHDSDKVISLSNRLFNIVKEALKNKTNCFAGKFKVGLSSPDYLMDGTDLNATFDGRGKGKPLNTHISCDKDLAYTELLSFASQLDYSKCGFNGNVVDLMTTPDFLSKHIDKFTILIEQSISNGVFQLQMNVVSSDVLIDAKMHPEEHKYLIVRVWGFSAYYVELPEYYQDMLIERALRNEGKIAC